MTKKQAYLLGRDEGGMTLEYGDFTPDELMHEDLLTEAYYKIAENSKKHPKGRITRLSTDEQWWAYEKGLGDELNDYLERQREYCGGSILYKDEA